MVDKSFYSSKPFVSHDGPDENGVRAEVRVGFAFGIVDTLKPSEKGKSVRVEIPVANTKYATSGWARADGAVHKMLERSKEEQIPIEVRVESIRKANIDRQRPIAEVVEENAQKNIFKSIAAARFEGDKEWTIGDAKTRFEEDPKSPGGTSAYDHDITELSGNNSSPNSGTNNSRSGSTPPWKLRHANGEINVGSYAVGIPAGLFSFVNEYAKDNDLEINGKHARVLARALLKVANDLQVEVDSTLDAPDLDNQSHVRARAIMFESVRTLAPITEETVASTENLKEWTETLLSKSANLWRWSIAEVERITD